MAENSNIPSRGVLIGLINSIKNEAFQYPLLFAWEKYKYGAHWDFWEEGHDMFQYLMFEAKIREIIPQLIDAINAQKEYFHPRYKDVLSVYAKLREDLESGVIK